MHTTNATSPDNNTATPAPAAAIGYCRVSTDRQETDRQRACIDAWARAAGVNLLRIIEEPEGQSGRSAAAKSGPAAALDYYAALAALRFDCVERAGYAQLLRAICSGEAQIVVFYALDRFSRDTIELLLLEKILAANGCALVTTAEGTAVDTRTAAGKFIFRILAAKAELECDQSSERTSATLRRMVDRGEMVGRPPVGWRAIRAVGKSGDAETTGFEHDPDTWPLVEKVVALRKSGLTYSAIAAATHADGADGISPSRIKAYLDAHDWCPPTPSVSTAAARASEDSQPQLPSLSTSSTSRGDA